MTTLIEHAQAPDANGNPAQNFCRGCEADPNKPCVLPEIRKTIEGLDRIEEEIEPSQAQPAAVVCMMSRVKIAGNGKYESILWAHDVPKLSENDLISAIAAILTWGAIPMPKPVDLTLPLSEILRQLKAMKIEVFTEKLKPASKAAQEPS